MRLNHGMIALRLSAAALALPMTGCAGGGLVYDSDWRDYQRWNRDENRYYWQWEIRTHRDHQAFQSRSAGDQLEYLGWRDYGSWVEVTGGLAPGTIVVLNPADDLQAGQRVRVASK